MNQRETQVLFDEKNTGMCKLSDIDRDETAVEYPSLRINASDPDKETIALMKISNQVYLEMSGDCKL